MATPLLASPVSSARSVSYVGAFDISGDDIARTSHRFRIVATTAHTLGLTMSRCVCITSGGQQQESLRRMSSAWGGVL